MLLIKIDCGFNQTYLTQNLLKIKHISEERGYFDMCYVSKYYFSPSWQIKFNLNSTFSLILPINNFKYCSKVSQFSMYHFDRSLKYLNAYHTAPKWHSFNCKLSSLSSSFVSSNLLCECVSLMKQIKNHFFYPIKWTVLEFK